MYTLDKQRFGGFVALLRKEAGLTQKELAGKIHVTDKAVSKWETGQRCPDIALLVPLAQALGVTVTELLECRKMEIPLPPEQVDTVVRKTVALSDRSLKRRLARACAVGLVLLALLGACFISYVEFQTPNFLSAGVGLFRVMVLEEPMVQVSALPRVVLAGPEDAMARFEAQLAEEGYTRVDQLGRMHIVEKNGVRRQVEFSVNGYFARWIWR